MSRVSRYVELFRQLNKNAGIELCWQIIGLIWPSEFRPSRDGKLGFPVAGEKGHNLSISQYGNGGYGIKRFNSDLNRMRPLDLYLQVVYGDTSLTAERAKEVLEAIGQDTTALAHSHATTHFHATTKKYAPAYKKGLVWFLNKELNSPHNRERVLTLLKGLTRNGLSDNELLSFANKYQIGYSAAKDGYSESLKIFKFLNGEAVSSVDHNRPASKIARDDGTFPPKDRERRNGRPALIGITDKLLSAHTVIMTEGVSDWANLASRGFHTVTPGSATTRLTDEMLSQLKGKRVFLFPDADIAGLTGATKWVHQIHDYNKRENANISPVVFWWANWFSSTKLFKKVTEGRMLKGDLLTEMVEEIILANEKAYVGIELLKKFQQKLIQRLNLEVPEEGLVENFRFVKKGKKVVKNGFDFTDFLNQESNERSVMLSFLDKVARA